MKRLAHIRIPAIILAATSACNGDDGTCVPGTLGCSCSYARGCVQPDDGQGAACVDGICVTCTLGSTHCGCMPDDACLPRLTCTGGICSLPEGTIGPPTHPRCYTPCAEGLVLEDGTYLPCSAEGLMEGCLDGAECVDGSCLAAGAVPAVCSSDIDCPDFQACHGGTCYADCAVDTDCASPLACHRHVCRWPCHTTERLCPAEQFCSTVDGESGFCMPLAEPQGDPHVEVIGTFELSKEELVFSNVAVTTSLTLINHGPTPLEFMVRKIEHREYSDAGFVLITDNPLHWLSIGEPGAVDTVQQVQILVDGDGAAKHLVIGSAYNPEVDRWEGVIEISNRQVGTRRIDLRYIGKPEGQWSGRIYYFANFPDDGLEAWLADRSNITLRDQVGNAFFLRWAAFKDGSISLHEMQAVLSATQAESWKWPLMDEPGYCPHPNHACYPYSNGQGYSDYTFDLDEKPIPTGVTEMPVAMNLREDAAAADPRVLSGKLVTAEALHYAGDPSIRMALATDPKTCSPTATGAIVCELTELSADILVGGRYLTDSGDAACNLAEGFELTRTPWLIEGFIAGTEVDPDSELRYRYECRDTLLPFGDDLAVTDANISLSASNPIPDGRTRRRSIELVDGALINSRDLLIIFREHFPSFLDNSDTKGFAAYGVMLLSRNGADLDDDAFVGSVPVDSRPEPAGVLEIGCSPKLLDALTGSPTFPTDVADVDNLAGTLLDGYVAGGPSATPLPAGDPRVHYFCEETGLFDGGRLDDGSAAPVRIACPGGSRVQFFLVDGMPQDQIAALPCQQRFVAGTAAGEILARGTCQETLNTWVANGTHNVFLDPDWRCTTPGLAACSKDRLNLRSGKLFWAPVAGSAGLLPLRVAIDEAFRYKTRFRDRSGTSTAFAPTLCVSSSDAVPYCYDPLSIETIQERVDCAVSIYTRYFGDVGLTRKQDLRAYLRANFAFEQDSSVTPPVTYDGFERLNAELLIMMGDEAYTSAFASRFDLASSSMLSFAGSLFEPGGIDLSGGAGFEMHNLYQAVQYYQLALDRFYALSPEIWASLDTLGSTDGFVTTASVASYFDRLVRASSQKARAWSEIAQRYQSFNRPDLARLVVERAYTGAYLESVVLARMMLKLELVILPNEHAELVERVEHGQNVYRSALLAMRDVYDDITDNVTFFGFPSDYVPFPALDPLDINAFEKVLASAQAKLQVAAEKEQLALGSSRDFETDAASFQNELISIRNNYENQLAGICGTFVGEDGRVYPAIPKYAHLTGGTAQLGDPCGFVGNGELYRAMLAVDDATTALTAIRAEFNNLVGEVAIERQRFADFCGLVAEEIEYVFTIDNQVSSLQSVIDNTNLVISSIQRSMSVAQTVAGLTKCSVGVSTDCPMAAVAGAIFGIAAAGAEAATVVAQIALVNTKKEIAALEAQRTYWLMSQECRYAQVDSNALVKTILLRFMELDIAAYRAQIGVQSAVSEVGALRNRATRLMAEQSESEQLAINIEAARNDPNTRIYKNDAIITADRTFESALREAYRASKVFEYYTSQSYGHLGDLFLVRMATHGDISLETYLGDLEDAFYVFEEQYGNPDVRVQVVSLRDNILNIPRIGEGGKALSEAERLTLFRREITDAGRLDARGYTIIPFSTGSAVLSPLTRNHKVKYIEAEIIGSDVGDAMARLYLRQRGTGVVRALTGDTLYYGFPARTAVLNPLLNGERVFESTVYRNERLRDRPFINTQWELVINQKDELANKDVNLNSLTDIRLYILYTDFTEL